MFSISKTEYRSKNLLLHNIAGESNPDIHTQYNSSLWKEILNYEEVFGGMLHSETEQFKRQFILEHQLDIPLKLANIIFTSWESDPSVTFKKEFYRPVEMRKDGLVVIINVKEI